MTDALRPRVLCSTGALIGRINGHNHRLALLTDKLHADGLEVMLYGPFYENLTECLSLYRSLSLPCPVVHADKRIGDLMSGASETGFAEALDLWKENCRIAALLGAAKIVGHIWGIPDSDLRFDLIARRYGLLHEAARSFGLLFVAENTFCVHGSPLSHFAELAARYPDAAFTVDTRPAAFHGETGAVCRSPLFGTHVRHIHISDYAGEERDFGAIYPILQPGRGRVDFPAFFSSLRAVGCADCVTLEAPAMLPDGFDAALLNRSLDLIRGLLSDDCVKQITIENKGEAV